MAGMTHTEMPFLDHLEELRWRLLRCAIAIALGVGVSFGLLLTREGARNWVRLEVWVALDRVIKQQPLLENDFSC